MVGSHGVGDARVVATAFDWLFRCSVSLDRTRVQSTQRCKSESVWIRASASSTLSLCIVRWTLLVVFECVVHISTATIPSGLCLIGFLCINLLTHSRTTLCSLTFVACSSRLVVLQFIMPNLSFLGHLSGILLGTAQNNGWIPLTPGESTLRNLDSAGSMASIVSSRPSFVPTTSISFSSSSSSLSMPPIVESIRTTICGRGDAANANIRLFSHNSSPGVPQDSWGRGQRLGGADPVGTKPVVESSDDGISAVV